MVIPNCYQPLILDNQKTIIFLFGLFKADYGKVPWNDD